ncbi:unnamed protein product [Ectocarpus sp. 6 AP-2014]
MVKAGIGLDPSKPLLPPVDNLRMIYLKKPLTDAENDLHQARIKLRDLEEGQAAIKKNPVASVDIEALKKSLFEAMRKLQNHEDEYFATRYVGHNKPVLHEWNNGFKQTEFTDFLNDIITRINHEKSEWMKSNPHQSLQSALTQIENMVQTLKTMNGRWYNASGNRKASANKDDLRQDHDDILRGARTITTDLEVAKGYLKPGDQEVVEYVSLMRTLLIEFSEMIQSGKWDYLRVARRFIEV